MPLARPAFASHPFGFGRGPLRAVADRPAPAVPAIGEDLKLFATTFLVGFLFVSVLIY